MNKAGGFGVCPFCCTVQRNISYHISNECTDNPDSWATRGNNNQNLSVPVSGLNISCDGCGNPITQPAALLFSSPLASTHKVMTVKKFHLCHECYTFVCDILALDL